MLWRFPFENDDVIECGDILGRVENVALRMTQIRLLSGELIVCPNSFLFKNPVKVLTNQKVRRTNITTGIAYDENIEESAESYLRDRKKLFHCQPEQENSGCSHSLWFEQYRYRSLLVDRRSSQRDP